MDLEKHHILFPLSPLTSVTLPVLLIWLYMAFYVSPSRLELGIAFVNITVLKVFSCGGWATKKEAPCRSPNEIFPGF